MEYRMQTWNAYMKHMHRTHPWSLRPGGVTVVVLYINGNCYGYDKVKRPQNYMKVIIGRELQKIDPDIENIYNSDDNEHIETLQEYVEGICITKEGKIKLTKVWHKRSNANPWKVMEPYATE